MRRELGDLPGGWGERRSPRRSTSAAPCAFDKPRLPVTVRVGHCGHGTFWEGL
jgi:hypothetical protein